MKTTSTAEDLTRIAARYPKPSMGDRLVFIAAAVAMVVAVGLVVLSGLVRANPPVVAMVRAFEVVGPRLLTAEIVVQRTDPSAAATCSVFAQAPNFERVGELEVAIPPGTDHLTDVHVEIKTLHEATSVTLVGCRLTP